MVQRCGSCRPPPPPDWRDNLGQWGKLLSQDISNPGHALCGASRDADQVPSAPDARLSDTTRRGQAVLDGDSFIAKVPAQVDAPTEAQTQASGGQHQTTDGRLIGRRCTRRRDPA